MAEKSKKKGAGQGGAGKRADLAATTASMDKLAEKAALKKAEADDHEAGLGDGHAHAEAHAAHGHKPDIREYFVIFAVLAVLTVIEVGITKVPGINHTLMGLALVSLAVTKAAIVGLFYMHLKHETKVLKLTVALPVAAPALYALVLMSEAAWRLRF